jgi:argininosuccinate lyase
LLGLLTGLLAVLKGLPSAYDKDLQEDKVPVFEAADTIQALLPVIQGILETITVHADRMRAAIDDTMLATDLADYLVGKGVPFRQAHSAAGKAVRRSLELGVPLSRLAIKEYHAIHVDFGEDVAKVFDPMAAAARRNALGGTAPEAVRRQIELAGKTLSES